MRERAMVPDCGARRPRCRLAQRRYTLAMPASSWLFVKHGQSIWVERVRKNSMIVAGPAAAREERSFPDEDSLQASQISLGEQLTNGGWFLWGFDRERRETTERRGVARPEADRRRAAG